MDYKRNLKYFKGPKIGGAIVLIIFGVNFLLFGSFISLPLFADSSDHDTFFIALVISLFPGLPMTAGGIAMIIVKKATALKDEDYDAAVASMLYNIQGRALSCLGLDANVANEIAPISFDGYVYRKASKTKQGKDGLWRTNKYEFVMLFFSAHEIHCYTYDFDTTSPQQAETTDVYFYKDIVSVSTATDTVTVKGQHIDYEYFKLTTSGGTGLSVSLRDAYNAQQSINAMRALLKTKKQQQDQYYAYAPVPPQNVYQQPKLPYG